MKFLCLHGAFGSSAHFNVQLAPIEQELEKQAISFKYIDAPHETSPPDGFDTYFGPEPHRRWIKDDSAVYQAMVARLREFPPADSPEDAMRKLIALPNNLENPGDLSFYWQEAIDYIYQSLEDDADIEGIIGYSEGAYVASTLILDEARRLHESQRPRQIKCAIFLNGWPPATPDAQILLSDENDTRIEIPTLHVLGANDPYKSGAVALFNVCDDQNAELFDTGKGHMLPRSGLVLNEFAEAVRNLISCSREIC